VSLQLFKSVTVRFCWPLVQALHEPVCQFGVHGVHDSVVSGLPAKEPQPFESVQVRVCELYVQVPQDEHCQLGVQFELVV